MNIFASLFQRLASAFGGKEKPAYVYEPPARGFKEVLIAVAKEQANLGIRETSTNQGPGIQKYWPATSYGIAGYHHREPWCAAFMAWTVREACLRHFRVDAPFALPRSAAVNDWPIWGRGASQWAVVAPRQEKVKAGDIVCFDFNGRDESGGTHIAIATGNERPDGTYETVEGNTSPEAKAGSAADRDGGGIWRKRRLRSQVHSVRSWVL